MTWAKLGVAGVGRRLEALHHCAAGERWLEDAGTQLLASNCFFPNRGTPIAGFWMENPSKTWMISGYTHDLGNLQMKVS